MDEVRITKALEGYDEAIGKYLSVVDSDTALVKQSMRRACLPLKETVTLDINSCEIYLVRSTILLTYSAEYHILRAYFHASPSLWDFIKGLWATVMTIIQVITAVNTIVEIITSENIVYWVDKLIPGFQESYNNMMNKISEFSSLLGWGVDGVTHLLNAAGSGAELWGLAKGNEWGTVTMAKLERTKILMTSYSEELDLWQSNPGQQISKYIEHVSHGPFAGGARAIGEWTDKIGNFGEKAEQALTGLGTISSELLAIRNDMPALIAQNIPPGIWNALELADTTINDRILPALTNITDRLEELDAVIESYQKKAEELSDRLLHPGDLLAEIDKLPGYARQNQLVKIDGVTSQLMREGNEAAFASMEGDLTDFAKVAAALSQPPAPLSFMELELPGRSPGITPEPHESWVLETDY